jgi:hypothetical protein
MRGEQGDRAESEKCHTIPTETDRVDVVVGHSRRSDQGLDTSGLPGSTDIVSSSGGPSFALVNRDDGALRLRRSGNSRIRALRKLPVVPICRRETRLRRRANQNDLLAHPASMKRDVTANRHDTWGGDAMDADGTSDERGPKRTAKSRGPGLPTLRSSS